MTRQAWIDFGRSGGAGLRARYATLWLALLAAAFAAACGDDGGRTPSEGDEPSGGNLRVDAQTLRGEVRDGELMLNVGASARGGSARGTLRLSLIEVDGSETLDRASVDYDIDAGESDTLTATLSLPDSIDRQSDRVRYSVRVTDRDPDSTLRVTRSLLHVLSPYEVTLEGPETLRSGTQGSYRARVTDPLTHAARSDVEVELRLAQDGETVESERATTDETGIAIFALAAEEAGDYEVSARSVLDGSESVLAEGIEITQPGAKVLLTTDKPLYQPGQTIHLRALALVNPENEPVADADVTFEVEDGKGNKVMKRDLRTDEYGIAATSFTLARVVNMGTFKVRALMDEVSGERTVEVARYVLPKFEVGLRVDKSFYGPGEEVGGALDARYFFGKDVAGARVEIEALTLDVGENVFQRVMGMTDAQGEMDFSVQLPDSLAGIPLQNGNALVTLRATVTDTADQVVVQERALTVASEPIQLSLVPESTTLVQGLENRFHLFATDPLGAPIAGAEVAVTPQGGAPVEGETDPFGHLEFRWTPEDDATDIDVTLTPESGDAVRHTFRFGEQEGSEHLLVRTDKSIYGVGESVAVQILTSRPDARVYVDWLNQGQAVDMQTLDAEDGAVTFHKAIDEQLIGENRIEAYVVEDDGNITRAGRTVLAKTEGELSVSLSTDQPSYRPGDPAELTFSVVDEGGEPTVAALGVQIVDEAVFALIDARPGLLRTYFEIEEAFAEPAYEIAVPPVNFERVLFEDTSSDADPEVAAAAQIRAEAGLAAIGTMMTGLSQSSWPHTLAAVEELLTPYLEVEKQRLIERLEPLVAAEIDRLDDEGCAIEEYYCDAENNDIVILLAQAAARGLEAYDFWGNAYTNNDERAWEGILLEVGSAGPDEAAGSDDDLQLSIAFDDLGVDAWGGPVPRQLDGEGVGLGGQGALDNADADGLEEPTHAEGDNGDDESGGPRVRREFPETLYVNPSIITGPDGKATVALDMADSITEWRVSAMANSRGGKLGGGQSGITVFQDFFVDVDFPAELTRGDEVDFPIVVYNYLDEAQSVRLELDAGDWYSALGDTTSTVELESGEVKAVHFPVRVEEVGAQTLTVRGFGGDASDAVARNVRVVPDGQPVANVQSGALAAGGQTLSASFPADAVAGSAELYLNVFPAFLAQAVEGLDSLLQVPSGCFEQTTSTTWPNVLVTSYMEETDQSTPEILLKAESLISAGYQRLLTFEHAGGGFSWFGEQDPEPFLSVTAFGVMEFADMARVHAVDPDVIDRTARWLADQQQADGSWEGDVSEFFSFHESSVRNSAFTVWALASAGFDGAEIDRGLDFLKSELSDDADAYTLSLVANAFATAAPNDSFGGDVLERLDAMKTVEEGKASWDSGGTQTNFYGGGDDAAISTTALVAHAMLTAQGYAETVNAALDYLTGKKDALGNFGSTQATVWTLKTLLLSALRGTEGAVGELAVGLNGEPFAAVSLREDQADVMTTVDMTPLVGSGDHTVELSFVGEGKVSYSLVAKYHVPSEGAPASDGGPLAIDVAYDRTTLAVDETVGAEVTVRNQTDSLHHMILVTVGIPPGFDVLTEDLDAYVEEGTLSHFEKTGKQLTLYLSELPGSAEVVIGYRLRATMPVRVADGGAEAYPYYEPTQKAFAPVTTLVAM